MGVLIEHGVEPLSRMKVTPAVVDDWRGLCSLLAVLPRRRVIRRYRVRRMMREIEPRVFATWYVKQYGLPR